MQRWMVASGRRWDEVVCANWFSEMQAGSDEPEKEEISKNVERFPKPSTDQGSEN